MGDRIIPLPVSRKQLCLIAFLKALGVRLYSNGMNHFYAIVGRMFFPRLQEWEQQRNARMMVFVVMFSLVFAFGIASIIWMMYYRHK